MGSVKKIFVLHGWAYSTDSWKPLEKYMQSKGVQLVLLNIPGLTEQSAQIWSLNDYVEWLNTELENEHQPILLGHSNGGRIAIAFAAKYPNRLKQLILLDSAGMYHNELPLRIKRFLFRAAAKIGKKVTSSNVLKKLLYIIAREHDYEKATPEMKRTMLNLVTFDVSPLLKTIKTQTLIIWGKLDKSTPLSDGKYMHKEIQHSTFFIVDDAKHSPQFTHSTKVGERILQAL